MEAMDAFVAGSLFGILLGLLLNPILRSWLQWRAVGSARREAALADAILARMDQENDEPPDDSSPNDAWRS